VLRRGRVLLMKFNRAMSGDVAAVEALLAGADLPLDGAAAAFDLGIVGRVGPGSPVVAAAAIERFGDSGLLRSVVVAPDHRGTGIGRELVAAAEGLAAEEGIHDLWLLTETAIDWFPRLGYQVVERSIAAAAVGESVEFTTLCRDTGVPMHRALGGAR
jgi:amino-acid N-acetyltransferase